MKVAFVILHYWTIDVTIRCVESIQKVISYDAYEIVIVDNGSGRKKQSSVELQGACFISADAVKTVGLPIKEYFIWGDDTEYTLRLSRYYGQGWLVGKSLVLHKRLNGQALSIKEEDNPNRIPIYYYYVRNYLINLKLYYFGYCGAFAKTLHFMSILIKILFGKSKFK